MKVFATDKAPGAIGPYSQGFIANGFVFTSGQIPVDPATGEVPEGITAQAHQSCKNIGALLEAAGVGYDNVIKTTCFLADMADFGAFNEVKKNYRARYELLKERYVLPLTDSYTEDKAKELWQDYRNCYERFIN